jgi:hypothetical protein
MRGPGHALPAALTLCDTGVQGGVPEEEGGAGQGLPLGQLAALRHDGSTSAAAMKARARALRQQHGAAPFKRGSKHRPVEMSSRRPVPVLRDAVQAGKRWVHGLTSGGCPAEAEPGMRAHSVLLLAGPGLPPTLCCTAVGVQGGARPTL